MLGLWWAVAVPTSATGTQGGLRTGLWAAAAVLTLVALNLSHVEFPMHDGVG